MRLKTTWLFDLLRPRRNRNVYTQSKHSAPRPHPNQGTDAIADWLDDKAKYELLYKSILGVFHFKNMLFDYPRMMMLRRYIDNEFSDQGLEVFGQTHLGHEIELDAEYLELRLTEDFRYIDQQKREYLAHLES